MKQLILRTAPFNSFEKALTKVRTNQPKAEITVLIQRSAFPFLSNYGDDLKYILVNDGTLNIWNEGWKLVRKIRKERFDSIIILQANLNGKGYFNTDLLSLLSGIRKVIIFDNDGNFYSTKSHFKKLLNRFSQIILGTFIFGIVSFVIKVWEKKEIHQSSYSNLNKNKNTLPERRNIEKKFNNNSKKRIVFIDLMFTWPPHGGGCVDIKEVASGLKRRGFEVDLIVPEFEGIFQRGKVDETLLIFPVHKIGFSKTTFNFYFLPKKIKKKVRELNPDYVYLGDSYFLKPFLIEALKNYKIISRFYTYELLCPNYYLLYRNRGKCDINYLLNPIQCLKCAIKAMKSSFLSLNLDVWSHEFIVSLAFLPSYHRRVIRALSMCDMIVTYNNLAKRMLSEFHNRVVSIPGGVNVSDFKTGGGSNNGIRKILVSGRLSDPRKGLDFFLKTVRKLREKRQDFRIYLTQDRKLEEDYIISLGWMDHEKLKKIYQEMDICVVPSIWEEPFGMVAVEAMAAGKPVVASAVAGPMMSVENGITGLLFNPGDSSELTKCLNRLLDDPGLMKNMGEAGRKRVEKYFDWECIIDRYCNEIFKKG